MTKRLYLLNTLALTLLFTGCMGYHLGGSRPEGVYKVTMGPVLNETTEPAIELQMTRAMRQRIQMDGRMKLVNEPKNADAIIEITLTDYSLTPIAFSSEYKTTPEIYRIRITGEAELRSLSTGKVLTTSKTYGEASFHFKDDIMSSKRDTLPAVADNLSKYMLDDLIEAWE